MKRFRKTVRRRQIAYLILVILPIVYFFACFALGFIIGLTGSTALAPVEEWILAQVMEYTIYIASWDNFMLSAMYYLSEIISFIYFIYCVCRYISLTRMLGSKERLRRQYILETDERERLIRARSGGAMYSVSIAVSAIGMYVAAHIGGLHLVSATLLFSFLFLVVLHMVLNRHYRRAADADDEEEEEIPAAAG